MNAVMERAETSFSLYKEMGKTTLELIALSGDPLTLSCRVEAVGMFVESMVTSRASQQVRKLDPAELRDGREVDTPLVGKTVIPGEKILRDEIQRELPCFEIHRANRNDMAHLAAALTTHELWDSLPGIVTSALNKQKVFEMEQRAASEQLAQSRREAWDALDKSTFPPRHREAPSLISTASVDELQNALRWLTEKAEPIVASGEGIPQFLGASPLMGEINRELAKLLGKSVEEKMDTVSSLIERVQSSLELATELMAA